MLSDLFHRKSRRSVLIEINPFQILVAMISSPERGRAVVHCAAEFAPDDAAGLRQWLELNSPKQMSWMPAICGYLPAQTLLRRETVNPRRLAEPDYFANVVREEFKIETPGAWTFQLLDPLEGVPLPPENIVQPALICGFSNSDVYAVQQRLLDRRLLPVRLESSLLPMFGAVLDHLSRQEDRRSAVIVVIGEERTDIYILGKDGVYTPSPIPHGYRAIVHAAGKELGLPEIVVRERLRQPDDETRARAPKFLRALGRELKPLVDSHEMSTGQPVGGIYCAYLPANLAWLVGPLAGVIERPPITIDPNEWLPSVGLQAASEVPPFGPHWLGALSLLVEFQGSKAKAASRQTEPNQGRWHVDCNLAAALPNNQLVGRRFMAGAIAVGLVTCAITLTVWQLYVNNSLRADTDYWEGEMAKNQKLFDELNSATREMQARSSRLDEAYNLMASPYQVSDLVLNLGRTLPPNVRVDRIELSQGRIALRGDLREPSDIAGGTLNRYLDQLRRSPNIGPLFSSIGLTAMQRDGDSESLAFEISFKLKTAQP